MLHFCAKLTHTGRGSCVTIIIYQMAAQPNSSLSPSSSAAVDDPFHVPTRQPSTMDLSNATAALRALAAGSRVIKVASEVQALAKAIQADLAVLEGSATTAFENGDQLKENLNAMLKFPSWPAQATGLMTCTVRT